MKICPEMPNFVKIGGGSGNLHESLSTFYSYGDINMPAIKAPRRYKH